MRELDAYSGWLPAASTTRFGVGRHLDRPSRRAFRAGMDADARRTMHRLFQSARRSEDVYAAAADATVQMRDRPVLTVFGALGDYLRFRRKWRAGFADVTEATVPRGLHFPMCDDPRSASPTAGWSTSTRSGTQTSCGTSTHRPAPSGNRWSPKGCRRSVDVSCEGRLCMTSPMRSCRRAAPTGEDT